MDNFVKYFSVSNIKELEKEINDYIEKRTWVRADDKFEVTAISVVPSLYHGWFDAIVAFRRSK